MPFLLAALPALAAVGSGVAGAAAATTTLGTLAAAASAAGGLASLGATIAQATSKPKQQPGAAPPPIMTAAGLPAFEQLPTAASGASSNTFNTLDAGPEVEIAQFSSGVGDKDDNLTQAFDLSQLLQNKNPRKSSPGALGQFHGGF